MTVFARFVDEYPDREETRILVLLSRTTGQELQRIYLDEHYCADPECDCQRVMLRVHDPTTKVLAVIMYDFLGRPERTPSGTNPYLEPNVAQPQGAETVLAHVEKAIAEDAAYRDRLRRHYAELKELTKNPLHPLWPEILEDRRQMKRIAGQLLRALPRPSPRVPVRSQEERNRSKRERRLRRAKG